MTKINSNMFGASGELYVAHILLQKGYVVALPPVNTPAIDLLVSNQECSKFAAIQVKTSKSAKKTGSSGRSKGEPKIKLKLGYKKPKENASPSKSKSVFYVFVDFGIEEKAKPGEYPKCYIAAKKEIVDWCNRRNWKKTLYWDIPIEEAEKHCGAWEKLEKVLGKK